MGSLARWAPVWLAATILLWPVAAAEAGTVQFSGDANRVVALPGAQEWSHATAEILDAPASGSVASFRAVGVDGTVYVEERYYLEVGSLRDSVGQTRDQVNIRGATIVGASDDPERRLLLVLPDTPSPQSLRFRGVLSGWEPSREQFQLFPEQLARERPPESVFHDRYFTHGPRIAAAGITGTEYSGPLEFFAWEFGFAGTHGNGSALELRSGRTRHGMAGGSEAVEAVGYRFLHFVGSVARLELYTQEIQMVWVSDLGTENASGPLILDHATGLLRAGTETAPLQDQHLALDLAGARLQLEAPKDAGRGLTVRVNGGYTSMQVDGAAWGPPPGAARASKVAEGALTWAAVALLVWFVVHHLFGPILLSRRTRAEGWDAYVNRTLVNAPRRRIYETIVSTPGIQPFHVWKRLGGAFGSTLRGLERLEQVGFVRSFKVGRFRHYFPRDQMKTSAEGDHAASRLATRTGKETMDFLERHGPSTLRAIAEGLGLSGPATFERLVSLQKVGLASKGRSGGRVVFEAARRPETPATVHREMQGPHETGLGIYD